MIRVCTYWGEKRCGRVVYENRIVGAMILLLFTEFIAILIHMVVEKRVFKILGVPNDL